MKRTIWSLFEEQITHFQIKQGINLLTVCELTQYVTILIGKCQVQY